MSDKKLIDKIREWIFRIMKKLGFVVILAIFLILLIYLKKDITANTVPDFIATVLGLSLTALGFFFVVVQISTLAEQVQNEKERHNKDSEFKNFLEATKMLTSVENKHNATAQISAMYLLYDYAKKHSNKDNGGNLEKVIKILNRYATLAIYDKKDLMYSYTPNFKNTKNIIDDRKVINEWKTYGKPYQQVASIALDLNKMLFVYALNEQIKINLSGVVIFDFDIEIDLDDNKNLFDVVKNSPEMVFLCCKFSDGNKKINFSTPKEVITPDSVKGRMDISLSYFISCNLNGCDFSHSNLWSVTFEGCNIINAKFEQAECEGAGFYDTKIDDSQIRSMLFLSNKKGEFSKFRKCPECEQLEYGIIYECKSNCFKNVNEYEQFKNKK